MGNRKRKKKLIKGNNVWLIKGKMKWATKKERKRNYI
jgi:hypothetical protein